MAWSDNARRDVTHRVTKRRHADITARLRPLPSFISFLLSPTIFPPKLSLVAAPDELNLLAVVPNDLDQSIPPCGPRRVIAELLTVFGKGVWPGTFDGTSSEACSSSCSSSTTSSSSSGHSMPIYPHYILYIPRNRVHSPGIGRRGGYRTDATNRRRSANTYHRSRVPRSLPQLYHRFDCSIKRDLV